MSTQPQSAEPAKPYRPPFGTFVEGFDSILYSESLRQSNRLRLLAELFYGLTYDSKILLPEPVVNDNYVVIRLMRSMQHRGLEKIRESLVYVPYRDTQTFFKNALLSGDRYVCSSLSNTIELKRIEFLETHDKSLEVIPSVTQLLAHLMTCQDASADDLLVLDSFSRLIVGDNHWAKESTPFREHGFLLSDQINDWLEFDWKQLGGESNSLSPIRVQNVLAKEELWPKEKETTSEKATSGEVSHPWKLDAQTRFNTYFRGRSFFHKTMPLWRNELGDSAFDRMEEYVNSAYGIALQKTCGASTAVRTPMDIGNPNNTEAQRIMTGSESHNANSFEFQLNLEHLKSDRADGTTEHNIFARTESEMLDCLDKMFRDPNYEQLKNQLLVLKPEDGDYKNKFVDAFGQIADYVNELNGPFKLHIQGNFVLNVLNNVSVCKREILGQHDFNEANGCEHRNC